MAHTYSSNIIHCVFSTKERCSLIPADRTTELYAYLGGIARGEGFTLIAAGGTANHIHLLFVCRHLTPLPMPFRSSKEALPGGWGMAFPGRKDTARSVSALRRFRL